jgi:thiosulfate/3-mercaptopyruvate sulfurtransferase
LWFPVHSINLPKLYILPGGGNMSAYTHPEMLATTDWLADHLDDPDVQVIEVGAMGPLRYPEGHIPGALSWPWQESLWDAACREFVLPPDFAELMSRSGVSPDTTLVFYSEECQFAAYALWTCILRGHTRVKLLDGSRIRWVQEGRPLTTEVPMVRRTDYPVQSPNESGRIGREGVLADLFNPDRVLFDARSPEEYRGERVMPPPGFDHGAQRKGRIPGAQHLYYRELLNDDDTFKPARLLREAFEARGATPDKDIVIYCRLSHRATLVWFTAHYLLGYPRVRSYDGSWTEWGSMVGMPVET